MTETKFSNVRVSKENRRKIKLMASYYGLTIDEYLGGVMSREMNDAGISDEFWTVTSQGSKSEE